MKNPDKYLLIGIVTIAVGGLLFALGYIGWSFNEIIEAQRSMR